MTDEEFKKLVIKDPSQLALISGIPDGKIPFYDGGNELKMMDVANFNNLSKTAIPLSPTDPYPTTEGLYKPTIAGTYSNAGGLEAEDGYFTLFFYDGTSWSKSEDKFPEGLTEDDVVNIVNSVLNPIQSVAVSGNFENETNRNFFEYNGHFKNTSNSYLNSIGITKLNYSNISGNIENYLFFTNNSSAPNNGLGILLSQNNGKYVKFEWYVFSKDGFFPTNLEAGRMGLTITDSAGNHSLIGSNSLNGSVNIVQTDPQVFKLSKTIKFEFTGTLSNAFIASVLLASEMPAGYVSGDFAITGLKVAFANTLEELQYSQLLGDWQESESIDDKIKNEVDSQLLDKNVSNVNNLFYNVSQISDFLINYQQKRVDENNQLTIGFCGDSVMARIGLIGGNEISWTPDMNGGAGLGKDTGHFSPNMSQQIIACKFLTAMQFKDADVKYYSYLSSEVTLSSGFTNAYPVGADNLHLTVTTTQNDYVQLSFNSASFVKFIYSCYFTSSATRKIKVEFSEDNGWTWKTPAQLGLIENYPSDPEGDGIYYLPVSTYKWGEFIWRGLNPSNSYLIRVTKIDNAGALSVFGFETWSKPRLNVVVNAEGGNTANEQNIYPFRFYNSLQNQQLVIYELPYLNDLGSGVINNFKGKAITTSSPSSPITNDFYYASVDGTYTNFAGLVLKKGDYFEYNGSTWVKGSTALKNYMLNYEEKNKTVFEKLSKIGVEVVAIITHNAVSFFDKPFTYELGASILRYLTAKYGFAVLDFQKYQQENNLPNTIFSDGVHLNDSGVNYYNDLIMSLFNIDYSKRFATSGKLPFKKLSGSGNGSSTIDFGFEFSKIPKVRIYNNSSIAITNIVKNSFIVSGTGSFDWEAYTS